MLLPERVQLRVRLAGIDAPKKRQPFGQSAMQRLSTLVFGKTVTLVGSKQDRYRRLVAKILVVGAKRDADIRMGRCCARSATSVRERACTRLKAKVVAPRSRRSRRAMRHRAVRTADTA